MKKASYRLIFASLALSACLLTACGQSGKSAGSTAASTGAAASSSTAAVSSSAAGSSASTAAQNTVSLAFPASDAGKDEYNAEIYENYSCNVTLTLPDGWTAQERDTSVQHLNEPLDLAGVFSIYDLLDADGNLAGAIGYDRYDIVEGQEDDPAVVYAYVRMGSVGRFDVDESYEVVQETAVGTTATVNVLTPDDVNKAQPETVTNLGILSYDHDSHLFVAVELDAAKVTAEQQNAIAQSLQFAE